VAVQNSTQVTWPQALTWRMRRHLLDPPADASTRDVVRRLAGVQAQVASSAELAVRVRQASSQRGDVARALGRGSIVKTWAMRGSLHLLDAADAGAYLSLIASARSWERPSWQRYFDATPQVMERLRETVRETLMDGPLTREQLVDRVSRKRGLGHVRDGLKSGWGTLLKPIAWQGDLCFGPPQGSRVTFVHPSFASKQWRGLPEPEEAASRVIAAYLAAYAPATTAAFAHWLAGGWFSVKHLRSWFAAMADRIAEIDVDGERRLVLSSDVDEIARTKPAETLRLLPGFDQYVLGPGTADARVIAPARRSAVSKQAGWISPVIVWRGLVAGTWSLERDALQITWFQEAGRIPRNALDAEVDRLAAIMGNDRVISSLAVSG
jgi:hypothetical protein